MQIELTDEEKAWVEAIEFDALRLRDRDHYLVNAEIAEKLARSILKRKAVPEQRLKWFTDPEYNVGGRGSSRKQRLQNPGETSLDLIRSPYFLAHLRYFIFGPDLPQDVISAFTKAVQDCGQITSGDVAPLSKTARSLARKYGLNRTKADEFYKLALDTMGHFYASFIRDSVKQVK